MSYSTDQVRKILHEVAAVIEENKEYLTDLDAPIGDSDHGANMARGFAIAMQKMDALESDDTGDMLKTIAMALISNVGGASGPLYGTFFLKASGEVKGKSEIDLADLAAILKVGVEGVQMRGKAELGEKTMLDVLIPVKESVAAEAEAGAPCEDAVDKAAKLARECAEKTKDTLATKGRASYLGERSIGHIDPGAMSSCLMIETVAKAMKAG